MTPMGVIGWARSPGPRSKTTGRKGFRSSRICTASASSSMQWVVIALRPSTKDGSSALRSRTAWPSSML